MSIKLKNVGRAYPSDFNGETCNQRMITFELENIKFVGYRDIDIYKFMINKIRSAPRLFEINNVNILLFYGSLMKINNGIIMAYDTLHIPMFYFKRNDLAECMNNDKEFELYNLI